MMVTATGASLSPRAAASPPNPAPTMTTRGRAAAVSAARPTAGVASLCGVSAIADEPAISSTGSLTDAARYGNHNLPPAGEAGGTSGNENPPPPRRGRAGRGWRWEIEGVIGRGAFRIQKVARAGSSSRKRLGWSNVNSIMKALMSDHNLDRLTAIPRTSAIIEVSSDGSDNYMYMLLAYDPEQGILRALGEALLEHASCAACGGSLQEIFSECDCGITPGIFPWAEDEVGKVLRVTSDVWEKVIDPLWAKDKRRAYGIAKKRTPQACNSTIRRPQTHTSRHSLPTASPGQFVLLLRRITRTGLSRRPPHRVGTGRIGWFRKHYARVCSLQYLEECHARAAFLEQTAKRTVRGRVWLQARRRQRDEESEMADLSRMVARRRDTRF